MAGWEATVDRVVRYVDARTVIVSGTVTCPIGWYFNGYFELEQRRGHAEALGWGDFSLAFPPLDSDTTCTGEPIQFSVRVSAYRGPSIRRGPALLTYNLWAEELCDGPDYCDQTDVYVEDVRSLIR